MEISTDEEVKAALGITQHPATWGAEAADLRQLLTETEMGIPVEAPAHMAAPVAVELEVKEASALTQAVAVGVVQALVKIRAILPITPVATEEAASSVQAEPVARLTTATSAMAVVVERKQRTEKAESS